MLINKTLSASENFVLGDASNDRVSSWLVSIKGTGWTGAINISARLSTAGSPGATAHSFGDVGYQNALTHAKVAAGTDITADEFVEIPSNGLEVRLDYTHTAGSVNILALPVVGPGTTPWS